LCKMESCPFMCFICNFEKSYKIVENFKNCKPNFYVLCVTRTTTFPKHVYTFELQFLLEKLKYEIPRYVVLQNPYLNLSWILDMLWVPACAGPLPKIAQSYWRNLFIWIILCYWQICLDKFYSSK
jgi:hypothetical protein